MKNLSILIILFVLNCHRLTAEIVTVVSVGEESKITNVVIQATSTAYTNTYSIVTAGSETNIIGSISVRAGETAKVLSYGNGSNVEMQTGGYSGSAVNSIPQTVFVGPGSISLSVRLGENFHHYLTVQITRNDELLIPSGSVLVPADSSGPVSVILESSTNLVTWSSALPGTYGTTSQNQYFRVRAVRQTS